MLFRPRIFWLHEIKHDGFRVIARKNGQRVRSIAGRATI
jgi:ATP-dependent DNA ligase